jgi:hypothetical protein
MLISSGKFTDRRTHEQLKAAATVEQERADQRLEALWRERVAQNVQLRLSRKCDAIAAAALE